ncbi:hypothetical protein P8452_71775 [Trifolium repens]|nr:hypothetical protein P8452_71775 [Trifolium repens]
MELEFVIFLGKIKRESMQNGDFCWWFCVVVTGLKIVFILLVNQKEESLLLSLIDKKSKELGIQKELEARKQVGARKDLIEEEYELSLNAITDVQNMLVGGGTSDASGSGTAGEALLAAGPSV